MILEISLCLLELRLGGEKPVERNAMMTRKLLDPECVSVLDRQGSQAQRIQA